MSYRRHAAKPSVALWMLVAAGDVLLILSSVGIFALIALVSVVAVGAAAGYLLMRRSAAADEAVPAAVRVGSRSAQQRVSV
ncbi:MAG TPA: hypothetical protein VHN18_01915 [Micromonosporaceae bacterium]|nr:hypothetical protein [Micromonosporaceae bacterium]